MDLGFNTIKDILETSIQILGFTAIIFTIKSFTIRKKQHYFTVVNNCINKFQDNFAGIEKFDRKQELKYIDLVNEEIFYIINDYLPFIIAVEWIDGIIDILPIFNAESQFFTNPKTPITNQIDKDTLKLYPRIKNTFRSDRITQEIDLTDIKNLELRKQVIEDIFQKIFPMDKSIREKTRKALRKIYHNI